MTASIRRVKAGAVSLQFAEAGVGGRPLLLLHGFAGAKEDFGDWWQLLADRGWHVVAPDLRGHGASDHPPRAEDYSLELFETDVMALIGALGWDRLVLLGHSMGGMVSQAIAIDRPELLDGLVLMDTVPGKVSMEGGGAVLISMKVLMRLFGMRALARFVRRPPPKSPPSVRRLYAERPGFADWSQAKMLATSPKVAEAILPMLLTRADRTPELQEVDLPVLVIVGEHDMPGFLAESRRMADAIPGATCTELAGAAHSPQLETPDAWWAAITGFLDALTPASAPDPDAKDNS